MTNVETLKHILVICAILGVFLALVSWSLFIWPLFCAGLAVIVSTIIIAFAYLA